jgi:competence protein ComEC
MSRAWRIDPVLVLASALAFGAFACVAPGATWLVAAACAWFWRAQLGRKQLLCALLALALGWGRARHAVARFEAERAAAQELVSGLEPCALVGRVASSPVVHAGQVYFDAQLSELDCGGRHAPRALRVRLSGGARGWARGDQLSGVAKLRPVSGFRNFDLPDPLPGLARQAALLRGQLLWSELQQPGSGPLSAIDRWRAAVRERIEASYPPPARALARALVLGESDLDAADEAAFRKSGLAHLLAVSGTHLVFAVLGVLRGLEAVLRRSQWLALRWDVRRVGALLGLLLAPLYADFSGSSGSAWRAAFMLLCVLGGRALGRHVLPSRVVACSLGLGWLCDALVVFDPSFLLSLSATLGLSLLGQSLARKPAPSARELSRPRRVELRKLFDRIGSAALASLAASAPCTPILLLFSPGTSLAGVAANLLAAPLGEVVALPLCLTHALCAWWPALESGLALVASGALLTLRELAELTARVEWLFVELPPPGCWHIAAVALAAAGLLGLRGQPWLGAAAVERKSSLHAGIWLLACALGFTAAELAARRAHSAEQGREQRRLRVTALDVGQGDATLIDLPDGRLLLIDGGGLPGSAVDTGERVLLPTLRARRRSHLDIVVLSHPHPDHFGGLLALGQGVSIGELWYAGGLEPGGELQRWVAGLGERGVRLRSAAELCRGPLVSAEYAIDVLAPCPGIAPEQSVNDNSLVLRVRAGPRAALFVGDAEAWAEARLLAERPSELAADLLKVGHHGSRSSSSAAFLARVSPRLALISCGSGNRFGHPHPEALTSLAAAGAAIWRLDQLGSVSSETDGQRWTTRCFAC